MTRRLAALLLALALLAPPAYARPLYPGDWGPRAVTVRTPTPTATAVTPTRPPSPTPTRLGPTARPTPTRIRTTPEAAP